LTYDEPGVFHLSGTGWKDNNGRFRSYHRFREVPSEQWCYEVNCDTTIGGCGASISGDSKLEAIDAWNRRPVQVSVSDAQTVPEACAAIGVMGCNYAAHGPNGERQCVWCGESPPQFSTVKQVDSVPSIQSSAIDKRIYQERHAERMRHVEMCENVLYEYRIGSPERTAVGRVLEVLRGIRVQSTGETHGN
jgi:hypothetical protein